MARPFLIVMLLVTGTALVAPAHAQFGGIFGGDAPPRPPSNVPSRPPANRAPVDQPPFDGERLPPGPPPLTSERLPPGPPPGSRIQNQPLPPPPGSASAPLETAPPGSPPSQAPAATGPQRQPPSGQRAPTQQATTPPQTNDEVIVEPPAQKLSNPTAVFAGLDKITGRIIAFEVQANETVRFGALEVTPRACYTRPPTETQVTDGFIEVDELTLQGELRRIFTGWMFVASPGLNAVEHPIYDVWLTECKGAAVVAETVPEPAPQAASPRPRQQPPQQRRAQPAQPLPQPNVQQGYPSQGLPPPPFR